MDLVIPKKVLVISSDTYFKEMVSTSLSSAHLILNAEDLESAIILAREEGPDLVIMNYESYFIDDKGVIKFS